MISSIIRAYNIEDIVKKLDNVKQVSTGGYHTIFLLNDGTCKAVGRNEYGQLGDGTKTNRITPVTVQGINNCIGVSAGDYHTIFLLNDGTCKAVGNNDYGQLGDGTKTNRITPVTVQGINNCIGISATGGSHPAFLLSDNTCKAVGRNEYCQLGDGTTVDKSIPVFVLDAIS